MVTVDSSGHVTTFWEQNWRGSDQGLGGSIFTRCSCIMDSARSSSASCLSSVATAQVTMELH